MDASCKDACAWCVVRRRAFASDILQNTTAGDVPTCKAQRRVGVIDCNVTISTTMSKKLVFKEKKEKKGHHLLQS
jgi:hypothetical protein